MNAVLSQPGLRQLVKLANHLEAVHILKSLSQPIWPSINSSGVTFIN